MPSILSEIRAAFEHQIDVYGPILPADPGPATITQDIKAQESKPTIMSESAHSRIIELIPVDSPLLTLETLAEVEEYVQKTVLIALDETRINPVFGVGHTNADLMVIGEAPGADEDASGEPFVGRAGKLLTKILQAIGFRREDVYIANILKSRPPDNRQPREDEIRAHVPILYRQISLIKPKILLCVGKTSGTSLLGVKSSLADLRGTFHDFHGLPVMVTYHPAALLRNPNWKRPTWEDMQLLRDRYLELGGRPGSVVPSNAAANENTEDNSESRRDLKKDYTPA